MLPEATEAMISVLSSEPGNPSGAHSVAARARHVLEDAREDMAEVLGCDPGELVFTSGGTEADNLAIRGVHGARGGPVLCSAIEHHAVLEPVREIGGGLVPVDSRGIVDLDALAELLAPSVTLVSVMLANNEIGVVQPVDAVADVVREHAPDALVHTDAVHAFPWIDVSVAARSADLISISAHKFGGPKGVGALVVRENASLRPQILGGGQERERRSGTQNLAGIVGMARAARLTHTRREDVVADVAPLRDKLLDGLVSLSGVSETGERIRKVAGNAHVRLDGIDSEAALMMLDEAGVYASAASSCASGALEPSHVLLAMGFDAQESRTGCRFSLGATTTLSDVELALQAVPAVLERLRRAA